MRCSIGAFDLDKAIGKLELEVTQFLIDLDATVDLLRKRYMQEAA